MSTLVSSWVWHNEATKELKHGQLVILLALADIANDEGVVMFAKDDQITQEALAKKARMSVATFRRHTTDPGGLADLGLIEVTRKSATSPNSYRILMDQTTAQFERSAPAEGSYPQPELSDGTAHSSERSHRSAVSGHRDVLTSSTSSPQPPAERGSILQPHPNIAAALRGQPLASQDTRACKAHARQRSTCLNCWTFRKLTVADIPWCGECGDTQYRFEQVDPEDPRAGVRRCPRCHPLAMTPKALDAISERSLTVSPMRGQGKDFALPVGDRT